MWLAVLSAAAQDVERSRRYDSFFIDAICEQEKGHKDAAFDLLRHCVEIDSTRSEAYYYLARYYLALKQREKAFGYLQHAVETEPDNATYVETLANAYVQQRRIPEAISMLERLYALKRDRSDVLALLLELYEQQQDYDQAVSTLTKLETLEGKSERISYAKSNLLTKKGDKRAAINEMKALADQYPNDLNYRCLYANTLYMNGQQKRALAIYDKVLREQPDHRNALMAMLAHYNEQEDPVHAAAVIERILMNKNTEGSDRIALMRQVIGESEQAGGDSTRVLQLFDRQLNMPQSDADLALMCASYMNLKKMPTDSISRVLDKALTIAPDNAAVRLQLVSFAWQADDRQRVIDLCRDARRYNPEEMAFYYYQGIAYYQEKNLDAALNAFQNGIDVITSESDPDIVSDFYAVMGDILHQKHMDREAFAAYDSCLLWKDDNIGCLNNYAYYLSELGRDLERAEQMSYRTIKAEPQNATYLDTYAWILFKQGRYSEAKIYIDQTLGCDKDSSWVMLDHAGDIYYHVGDKEQALQLWQLASEHFAESADGDEEKKAILTRKIKLKKYQKE